MTVQFLSSSETSMLFWLANAVSHTNTTSSKVFGVPKSSSTQPLSSPIAEPQRVVVLPSLTKRAARLSPSVWLDDANAPIARLELSPPLTDSVNGVVLAVPPALLTVTTYSPESVLEAETIDSTFLSTPCSTVAPFL